MHDCHGTGAGMQLSNVQHRMGLGSDVYGFYGLEVESGKAAVHVRAWDPFSHTLFVSFLLLFSISILNL